MEQLTVCQTAFSLPAAVQNRKTEIDNLKSDIARIDKDLAATKPIVQEYNDKLKTRKELHRQLAKRELIFKEIVEFLDGFAFVEKYQGESHDQNSETETQLEEQHG
jgi:hypothetical protein